MAKKSTTSFVCQDCGYDTPSWMGKCPECGQWNTLKEIRNVALSSSTPMQVSLNPGDGKPKQLKEIVYSEKSRIQTEYTELNTVLGGGIVMGAAMLIAGDPGVGKSTLLLQLCMSLAGSGKKVLYISGEESSEQIKMRADRLEQQSAKNKNRKAATGDNLLLVSLTNADDIVAQIEAIKPELVIIDSCLLYTSRCV